MPIGTEISAEMIAISMVPVIRGRTPKLSGETDFESGRQVVPVKNLNRFTSGRIKKPMASLNNEIIIPMVIRIEKKPQIKRRAAINFSLFLELGVLFSDRIVWLDFL